MIESRGYFIEFYLMSKYYSNNKTLKYKYEVKLEGSRKTCPYFYYDAYYQLLNEISVSQIFGPYKYFTVQSLNSWFEKLKSLNTTIDSEQIKQIFKNKEFEL